MTVSNSNLGNGVEAGFGGLSTPRADTGVRFIWVKRGAISRVHNEEFKAKMPLNCYMLKTGVKLVRGH